MASNYLSPQIAHLHADRVNVIALPAAACRAIATPATRVDTETPAATSWSWRTLAVKSRVHHLACLIRLCERMIVLLQSPPRPLALRPGPVGDSGLNTTVHA